MGEHGYNYHSTGPRNRVLGCTITGTRTGGAWKLGPANVSFLMATWVIIESPKTKDIGRFQGLICFFCRKFVKKLPSRELTYPTLGKGKPSSKLAFQGIWQFPGGYILPGSCEPASFSCWRMEHLHKKGPMKEAGCSLPTIIPKTNAYSTRKWMVGRRSFPIWDMASLQVRWHFFFPGRKYHFSPRP